MRDMMDPSCHIIGLAREWILNENMCHAFGGSNNDVNGGLDSNSRAFIAQSIGLRNFSR